MRRDASRFRQIDHLQKWNFALSCDVNTTFANYSNYRLGNTGGSDAIPEGLGMSALIGVTARDSHCGVRCYRFGQLHNLRSLRLEPSAARRAHKRGSSEVDKPCLEIGVGKADIRQTSPNDAIDPSATSAGVSLDTRVAQPSHNMTTPTTMIGQATLATLSIRPTYRATNASPT